MATFSATVGIWQALPEPLSTDLLHTTWATRIAPAQAERFLRPQRCRQADLQTFAVRLMQESPAPFAIVWGAIASPVAHVLLTKTSQDTWQTRVCTEEELADWLHATGMAFQAMQRQRQRQQHWPDGGIAPPRASRS
ncbi:MAG: hypothetical protein FJZ47_04665 [Candidatus Tectomicrobia bacterium]|uniref:Uncharacterized protein n=1 Tax=Tectimicrobiota bacterium TaxID=2528274 RepID=A0A938B1H3_UNCTE|nr:hypothetical protein [Candidatus Tectomicrobia bacterium]